MVCLSVGSAAAHSAARRRRLLHLLGRSLLPCALLLLLPAQGVLTDVVPLLGNLEAALVLLNGAMVGAGVGELLNRVRRDVAHLVKPSSHRVPRSASAATAAAASRLPRPRGAQSRSAAA